MKRKILSTILAGALMVSAGTGVFAAEAGNADLFAEGFESTTAAAGGAVDTTTFRNGTASYVVTEDGTGLNKLEIPVGEAAEAWVGKMLVAEAWYHIDGELAGYKETEVEGEEEGTTTTVITGEQVTMAFYKDAETVNVYKNKHYFENAVWPNTNTEGWYRIRTTGIIAEAEELDLSTSKLVIGLTGAADETKLYVDDVRIFVTDNIVDMCTQGNSDFDTYDATCISGWDFWNCNGSGSDYGTVTYEKTYKTSGEYSVKYARKTAGDHGLICTVPLADFGAPEGESVVMSVNTIGEYGAAGFTATKFRLVHDYLSNSVEAYAETNYKTTVSSIGTVPAKNSNYLRVRRIDSKNTTDSFIYFDDVTIRVVPEAGFVGFKKSVTGSNAADKCMTVSAISHGDTVYPYAYFTAAQEGKVTLTVARYVQDGTTKRLDDVSVQSFASYAAKSFHGNESIQTTAITVPASGQYTYKIMAWSGDTCTPILETVEFVVE